MRYTYKIIVVFLLVTLSSFLALYGQQNIQYQYDALQRLTQVSYPDGTIVRYTYDALGNRLSKCVSTVVNAVICPGEVYTLLDEEFNTAGEYSLVRNNALGDEYQITLRLASYPPTDINISGENEICLGESTTLSASGGNSYYWNNQDSTATINVSPQTTTTYTVTCIDENGCSNTASVTVNVQICVPIITTGTARQISNTSAICSGEVIYDGGNEIVSRGICWSTLHNPTIEDSHTTDNGSMGEFTNTLEDLSPLTTYYVRAYATNSVGTSYGDEVELTMYLIVPKSVTEYYTMTDTSVVVFDHGGPNNNYDDNCDGTLTITAPSTNMILSLTGVYDLENYFDKLYVYDGTGTNNLLATLTDNSLISTPITTTQNTITLRFTSDHSYNKSGFELHISTSPAVIPSYVEIIGEDLECDQEHTTLTATSNVEGTFTWNNGMTGEQITVGAGSYTVTITTSTGASMTSAPFLVRERHSVSNNVTIEACESYEWNGLTYTSSGSFTQTLTSDSGCDSVVTLILTINPLPSISISGETEFCEGSNTTLTASGQFLYVWNNTYTGQALTLNIPGVYSVTGTDANGCSNTASVTVLEHPTYTTPLSANITEGQVFVFFGQALTMAGVYSHTLQSIHGCDSVIELTLTVSAHPVVNVPLNVSICQGESFEFYGQTLTNPGNYTHTIYAAAADTTITLTLTVNQLPSITISGATEYCEGYSTTLTAYGGNSYMWNNMNTGQTLTVTTPGLYSVTGTDNNGCSYTASISVIEYPTYITPISVYIAEGQTFWFFGQALTMAGVYSHTLQSVHGCDSVIELTLTVSVHPIVNVPLNVSICQGESFEFYGQTLTNSGSYTHTIFAATVDTVVTLNLTVNPIPSVSISGETEFCEGSSTTLTASGGSSFMWNNMNTEQTITVNIPGVYFVTGTDTNGCSSVDTISVDMLLTTYSEITIENVGPYLWNGIQYNSSGYYIQTLTGSNGCDSIVILHLNIIVNIADYDANSFNVFPNPTKGSIHIHVSNPSTSWTVYVYDAYGRLLNLTEAYDETAVIDLSLCASGIYMIIAWNDQQQILGTAKVLKE